jgi:hypothetical protein
MCTYPLRESAETHPGIVCAVHRGLIPGDLAAHERLDSFAGPELCIARVRRTAA